MLDENEFSEHESESATWIALADLMTGLMAIFLVICMIVMTNQNRTRIIIIKAVTESLQKANIEVTTDPKTGDVSIVNRDLLFDTNSAVLRASGKTFLDEFVPIYSEAVFKRDKKDLDEIVRVVIEGRTSRSGNMAHNMTLSLERANAVVQYIYNMPNFSYKRELLQRLTPVGRGVMEAQIIESEKDREVLFRFQFKGEFQNEQTPMEVKEDGFSTGKN